MLSLQLPKRKEFDTKVWWCNQVALYASLICYRLARALLHFEQNKLTSLRESLNHFIVLQDKNAIAFKKV